jgi:hypothetical protein
MSRAKRRSDRACVTGALEKDRYGFEHRFNPSLFGSSHKSHDLIENLDHIGFFCGIANATAAPFSFS